MYESHDISYEGKVAIILYEYRTSTVDYDTYSSWLSVLSGGHPPHTVHATVYHDSLVYQSSGRDDGQPKLLDDLTGGGHTCQTRESLSELQVLCTCMILYSPGRRGQRGRCGSTIIPVEYDRSLSGLSPSSLFTARGGSGGRITARRRNVRRRALGHGFRLVIGRGPEAVRRAIRAVH